MVISNNNYNVTKDPARVRLAQRALSTYDPNVKITGTWDEVSHNAFQNFGDKAFYSDINYARTSGGVVPNGKYYGVVITHGNWGKPINTEEDRAKAIEDFLAASYGGKPMGAWQYGTHFLYNGNGGVYNAKGMSSNPLFDRSKLTGDAKMLSDAVLESELYREGYKDIRFDSDSGGVSAMKAGNTEFGTKGGEDGLQVFRGARDSRINFRELGFSVSEKPYTTINDRYEYVNNGTFAGRSVLQFLGYASLNLGPQAFEAYRSSSTERLNEYGFTSRSEMEAWAAARPGVGETGGNVQSWTQRLLTMGLLKEQAVSWTQECEDIVLRMLGVQSA